MDVAEVAVEKAQVEPAPIIIRYEGEMAVHHEIELSQLGESLQGFGKTLAVAANFAATGNPHLHYDALTVKIIATPTPEHHCYEVWATIKAVAESKEFWAGAVGAGATVFAPIVTYILSSRNSEEMKHLSDALKHSMAGNQTVAERLVATVEKLAEALNPSVRKALAPIDRSCSRIDIFQGNEKIQTMDADTKRAYSVKNTRVADHSKVFTGIVTEFNMAHGTCQVLLEGAQERTAGRVLDPSATEPNNPYVSALASQTPLSFLAKYDVNAEGLIVKLHIFDTAEE